MKKLFEKICRYDNRVFDGVCGLFYLVTFLAFAFMAMVNIFSGKAKHLRIDMLVLGVILARASFFVLNDRVFMKRYRYEDRIAKDDGAVCIPFSLFEGSFSRNPSAWSLCNDGVIRNQDGQIFKFSYKGWKKYCKFHASLLDEVDRIDEEKEKLAVRKERESFEADPVAYLESHDEPIELVFDAPQMEYARLQHDVDEFKRQQVIAGIMEDYL